MHQNLLDRPDLPPDKRETAVFELAQDFHRAGLLDWAEDLFTKLDGSTFELQSLGLLLQIYEQEKDWPKAIGATRRMETLAKHPYFKEIAHYHCEMAQGSLLRSQSDEARRFIDQALAEYKLCTRRLCCWATSRRNRATMRRRSPHGSASSRRTRVSRPGGRPAGRRLPPDRRHRAGHSGTPATTRTSILRSIS
jgi:hypothetical protein